MRRGVGFKKHTSGEGKSSRERAQKLFCWSVSGFIEQYRQGSILMIAMNTPDVRSEGKVPSRLGRRHFAETSGRKRLIMKKRIADDVVDNVLQIGDAR